MWEDSRTDDSLPGYLWYWREPTDAKPLFFLAGELFSKSVEIEPGELAYRAIFLPKICSPPLGFLWPMDIGLDKFVKSLELLGRVYKPFLLTIDTLQPLIATWFSSILMNPTEVSIPACSYALLEATTFPALTDGIYPPAIIDHCGFSPLMDGYALRPRLASALRSSSHHHDGSWLATFLDVPAAGHKWNY
jgi:hypothetical protein